MLIQYAYIKPRSQFGKPCLFEETEPIVEENILPVPELTRDYVQQSHCHRGVQKSEQFALHEMQTARKVTKEMGMLHSEGGWPREINVKDEEAVQRFRRRVEKDENWAPRMKKLTDPMQRYILQNNAVNIYENYFDDMVPTALVLLRDIRTSNVYTDPQPVVRPVSHLSWSPGAQNRLAASYSFIEFETHPPNVNPCSYIWDIENPNNPVIFLRSSSPLMTIEFNPRDPSMLVSGLMSGQVCNWDIRIGNKPVQMSHRQFSHRNPANQALWTASKTNTEFFSASTDGAIKWWDIRKLRQPIDVLVMDLDDPLRADHISAIGVTALQFEPTIGSKFMAGMENGVVVNANRKATSSVDKLAARFQCHVGPVAAIDRNPFVSKIFLTVGDWTVKIWAEDTRENSLIAIREQDADLSGGCWSRSRYSVFFSINTTGLLEVYDVLIGMDSPVTTFRVCYDRLTAIAPHKNGKFLAVGSHDGNIYLVECSEGYTVNTRADKANLINYLERCSHFEKGVDARLKEIRQASVHEDLVVTKGKQKKEDDKEKRKKKHRPRKARKDFADDVELAESEAEFFRAVEREFASYPSLDVEAERVITQEISRKKKKREQKIEEEDEAAVQEQLRLAEEKKLMPREPISPPKPPTKEMEIAEQEDAIAKMETLLVEEKKRKRKRRGGRILGKVCSVEVCKPEICCADMEEEWKTKLQTRTVSKEKVSSRVGVIPTSRSRKLPSLMRKLPEYSAVGKRSIPLETGESLANVLANEVEGAKREVRAWRERIVPGKRDLWRLPRTTAHEKPEAGKERLVAEERPSAREARTHLGQFAETGPGKNSGSSQAREQARKPDLHLEKHAQESEAHPTPPVYSGEVTTDARTTTTMATVTSTTVTRTTTSLRD